MKRELVECELTDEGPVRHRKGTRKGGRSVTVNVAENPLAWLHSRGHLSDVQFAAGEALCRDWERAQLAPSVTMRWDVVRIRGSGQDQSLSSAERQLAASPGLPVSRYWACAAAGIAEIRSNRVPTETGLI